MASCEVFKARYSEGSSSGIGHLDWGPVTQDLGLIPTLGAQCGDQTLHYLQKTSAIMIVIMFVYIFFFKKFIYFIYLFLAVLGFHFCTGPSSSCGEQGLLFLVVHGLLIVVSSLVAEHGL